jgi:hypothetical protein
VGSTAIDPCDQATKKTRTGPKRTGNHSQEDQVRYRRFSVTLAEYRFPRELSSGQFTSDNHTPIIGSTSHIPIYRAKLSNDLRIIYQIDVVTESSNQVSLPLLV